MRALVVYESIYGNTHEVASHIAEGMSADMSVEVVPVEGATPDRVADADVLVVGGPTHVHGMTSARSRAMARADAAKPERELTLDPDAEGPGLRDWFDAVPFGSGGRCAAFDTRLEASPVLTGRASKGISRRLHRHGYRDIVDPESFIVDKQNHLLDGEADRAREWGKRLAHTMHMELGD
jgi:hypothetical protein